jgi:hypothetical protein
MEQVSRSTDDGDSDNGDSMSSQKYLSAAQLLDWEARLRPGKSFHLERWPKPCDKDQLCLVNLKGEDAIDEMRLIVYKLRHVLLRSVFNRDLIIGKDGVRATVDGDERAYRVFRDAARLEAQFDKVGTGARDARLQGAIEAERLAGLEAFVLAAQAQLGRLGIARGATNAMTA